MEKPELIVHLKEIMGSEHVLSSDMDLHRRPVRTWWSPHAGNACAPWPAGPVDKR